MGFNDHIDFELHEAIENLIDGGLLENGTPGYGVAQQVISSGYDSLSEKQKWVYDNVVLPSLTKRNEEVQAIQRRNSMPD